MGKATYLFIFLILFVSFMGFAQGVETFENARLTSTYSDGAFEGISGLTFTYAHSRNQGGYPIEGEGLMLRTASESYIEWTIPDGVGSLSFEYRKAYTADVPRQLEVIVNNEQVATTVEFGRGVGEQSDVYTLISHINYVGEVTIKIKILGSTKVNRQSVIDNISWTAYEDIDFCEVPANMHIGQVTFDESQAFVPVTWTPGGDETQWIVEYFNINDAADSRVIIVNGTPEITLDLEINTGYDIRVRALCGTVESDWVNIDTVFTTPPLEGYCGFENFDNSDLGAAYSDGSFVGNYGVTWSYVASRNENSDLNESGIDGKGIMLRRLSDESKIFSSPVAGGIRDFSVKLYKGFTGPGSRQVELLVNGISQGLSDSFDDYEEHVFAVSRINISGDVVIEIRNATSRQVIIDDITWTCYQVGEACEVPANMHIGQVTYDESQAFVPVTWTPGGDETQWIVEFFNINDAADSRVIIVNDTPEITLDLEINTGYDIRVRALCDTVESDWVNIDTVFTTPPLEGYCGFENFDNSDLGAAYSDGSFVGNYGVTWSYVASRNENSDLNESGIDGKGIMLRRLSDESKIFSSPVAGGIRDFSVKLYKGFTGPGSRQVELLVNGISQGLSDSFDDYEEHVFTVSGINISGDVVIEIRNATSRQVIIDDITWTCYEVREVCSSPEDVIISDVTASSAVVSWLSGGNEIGWTLFYGYAGWDGNEEDVLDRVEMTTSEYLFKGLEADTEYELYIYSECGEKSYSEMVGPISFTTLALQEPECGAVTDVVISEVTAEFATVTWSPSTSAPNDYKVNVYVSGITDPVFVEVSTDTFVGLTGLASATSYNVVITSNCGGVSVDSDVYTFTTEEFVCDTVTDVEITEVTAGEAILNWKSSATAVNGYIINVYEADTDDGADTLVFNKTVAIDVNTVEITDLRPLTSYNVYITSDCGKETVISDVTTFITDDIASVNDFNFAEIMVYPNPTSANLNINANKVIEEVQLYNILGGLVMTQKFHKSEITLDVSGLTVATYILKIKIDGVIEVIRVIKL